MIYALYYLNKKHMVVYDWDYFYYHPNNTNIDLCTFAVKRDNRILKFVDKTIFNQVIAKKAKKLRENYNIIISGGRNSIINLIKRKPYVFLWCIKLIEQDEYIINYLIQEYFLSLEYINWSIVPNFRDKSIIITKLIYNINYLQYIDPILIVKIIQDLDLLKIDANLSFITNNDSNELDNLIKIDGRYGWGIKFINQNEELCLNAVSKNGYYLKYVKYQTNKICIASIRQWYNCINLVKKQNRIIRLCATKIKIDSLRYIIKQNIELCTRKKSYLNILLPKIYKN